MMKQKVYNFFYGNIFGRTLAFGVPFGVLNGFVFHLDEPFTASLARAVITGLFFGVVMAIALHRPLNHAAESASHRFNHEQPGFKAMLRSGQIPTGVHERQKYEAYLDSILAEYRRAKMMYMQKYSVQVLAYCVLAIFFLITLSDPTLWPFAFIYPVVIAIDLVSKYYVKRKIRKVQQIKTRMNKS